MLLSLIIRCAAVLICIKHLSSYRRVSSLPSTELGCCASTPSVTTTGHAMPLPATPGPLPAAGPCEQPLGAQRHRKPPPRRARAPHSPPAGSPRKRTARGPGSEARWRPAGRRRVAVTWRSAGQAPNAVQSRRPRSESSSRRRSACPRSRTSSAGTSCSSAGSSSRGRWGRRAGGRGGRAGRLGPC